MLLLAWAQALHSLQQLWAGLVEMRIRDVHWRPVLARTDVLQAIDRRLVLDVKTRGVLLAAVVRIFRQLVAIGRYSCWGGSSVDKYRSVFCLRWVMLGVHDKQI